MYAMYRAILFDLDDTLYDFHTYRTGRLNQALAEVLSHHPHLDGAALIAAAIAQQVYDEQLPGFLRRNGVADERLIAAACAAHARDWYADMAMADDALHTLQALRRRWRLGLITNGPSRTQRAKIAHFGLADLMETLVVSEEVGAAKPDPAIFRLALERLGVGAAEALFVGDSPEHDLRGAAAAGMASVWINRRALPLPDGVPVPLHRITRLAELPPLLEELCS